MQWCLNHVDALSADPASARRCEANVHANHDTLDSRQTVAHDTYAPAVEPRHTFAWVTIDNRQHPALVLAWTKTADANGYEYWMARVLLWVDGEAKVMNIPDRQVRRG